MNHEDSIFMKHFSWVFIGLVGFTLAIALLAYAVHKTLSPSENPAREAKKIERIQPIAGVYAGETGQQAATAASAATTPVAAFDGALDAELVYQQVCAACHMAGAAGAPKLEAADWTERLAKGTDQLILSAINGIGVMPAKGGRPDLSDEQIQVTVEWMLAQSQ